MLVRPRIGLFSLYHSDKTEKEILNNISITLDTTPDKVIVEEMNQGGLFSGSKNNNLRKVYYDGKNYVVEIEKGNIKIVENN
ncbi:ribosomal protein S24E [Cytobacillus purgationiresistens]|uniref:Ribosomal protein S24E n=1 Tax=Cytobacillus purgationiresistens TaxID=863449 RepID=A0ABU0AKR7_9BACI|nr:ribosomal protein S24E [Cytobacillus purgationiresistens]